MFKMKRTTWLLCFYFLIIGNVFTGCGNAKDKNGSQIAEDGRSYGGLILGEMNEPTKTAFFDVTVKGATCYDTYQFDDGLYQAKEGTTYLVVNLTIENTYDADIPMSITDFTLDYQGNETEDIITGYGRADVNKNEFMDNIFTLKEGETVTKSILFTVESKKAYTLNYTEYYEDEFKGDSFSISLIPKKVSENQENSEEKQSQPQTEESNKE